MVRSRLKLDPAIIEALEEAILYEADFPGEGVGKNYYRWLRPISKTASSPKDLGVFVALIFNADFEAIRSRFMIDVPESLLAE